jgi:hypothetical protein
MRKRPSRGDFFIGRIEFETESGFPAIPLDPRALRAKENVKVEWAELEFVDESGTYFIYFQTVYCAQGFLTN